MIQGIIAVILLMLAVAFYFWERRSRPSMTERREGQHPDVVLGLVKEKASMSREMLFLRAPAGRQYGGYELLQSLLTSGLRFGEYHIFHRYEQRSDGQVILFSVAAATRSGILDPEKMGDFSCAGLTLFFTLNHHAYPSVVFELMLDMARQLAEDLGGVVLDAEQSPLDLNTLQQIRARIKQFETNQRDLELPV